MIMYIDIQIEDSRYVWPQEYGNNANKEEVRDQGNECESTFLEQKKGHSDTREGNTAGYGLIPHENGLD